MFEIPETLKNHILEDKVVLFVGAGLSKSAGAPMWRELLRHLFFVAKQEQLCTSNIDAEMDSLLSGSSNDLLIAAEYLRNLMSEKLSEEISKQFGYILKVQTIHNAVAELGCPGIVTTNFDKLIEQGIYRFTGREAHIVDPGNAFSQSRLDEKIPWVLKYHGTIDNPDAVLLSASDYERLPIAAVKTLENIFSRYTVLFVGYSLTDPDTLQILANLRKIFSGTNRRHFMLADEASNGTIAAWYLERFLKVQIIPYSNVSQNHSEVEQFLENLGSGPIKPLAVTTIG